MFVARIHVNFHASETALAFKRSSLLNRGEIRNRGRIMGSKSKGKMENKPKILCLHGFRTSGAILKKQVQKWPNSVLQHFDFHFIDSPFPSTGKSDVEGIYAPPFFEWFRINEVRFLILWSFTSFQFSIRFWSADLFTTQLIQFSIITGYDRLCQFQRVSSVHWELHAHARTIRWTPWFLTGEFYIKLQL